MMSRMISLAMYIFILLLWNANVPFLWTAYSFPSRHHSALDTITEKSVQEALDRLGSHRTVLVIAHRLGTIRNADNIVVLKDGVVAEQGTHDELVEKPDGIYAGMWNMQLHSTSNAGSQVSLVGSAEG